MSDRSADGAVERGIAHGMSWDHPKKGKALLLALAVLGATWASAVPGGGRLVSVIVRELPGSGGTPEEAVDDLGGTVTGRLDIIGGFAAEVPQGSLAVLAATEGVRSVTPDGTVRLLGYKDRHDGHRGRGEGPRGRGDHRTEFTVAPWVTGATSFWQDGYTGEGVDVALIDSGVVPVTGLTESGKVVNGADLSFESQAAKLRHLDTFGHGTHMAGIIAGRDAVTTAGSSLPYMGMAPGARLVNVKVADAHGAVDVSQVIAAIDWVVQHRNDNGLNIRVLNLSFGTDGTQSYRLDPLAYAAEVAWRKGIVVVVAGGNESYGSSRLNNPATDPYVLAVGAGDANGTLSPRDDEVADFSSCGNGSRRPDLVAPGTSVVGLRDPGSTIDREHPEGRIGSRFFRGSGTSQAAAVVTGAAALIIDQRPSITPDQVKGLLMSTARDIRGAEDRCQGAGMLDLAGSLNAPTPLTHQTWPAATGLGSLEGARGSAHLVFKGKELRGEKDIFGAPWSPVTWSPASLNETSWKGGVWNGNAWTGDSWSGMSWSGMSWSGISWSGMSWSGMSWSGMSWSGMSWSGMSWSGMSWSGMSWSGMSWSGDTWGSDAWSTDSWEA